MARIQVAAAGNAEKNINIIDARFQAEALRRLRGRDTGVLDNSFFVDRSPRGLERDSNADFMWKLTATNVLDISVGRGMATAYGYDIKSEQAVTFTATPPATGVKYLFIYLEWNYSTPSEAAGSIEIHDNGASASWEPPRRDNLITNPTGVYQMPLHRLEVNTNGIVTGRANWTAFGIATIGDVLLSDNARNAEHADEATYATVDPNSNSIDSRIKNLITRCNNLDTRCDNLGFKSGVVSVETPGEDRPNFLPSTPVNSITKIGKYVLLNLRVLNFTVGPAADQKTSPSDYYTHVIIPSGFRPKSNTEIFGVIRGNEKPSTSTPLYGSTVRFTVRTDGEILPTWEMTGLAGYRDITFLNNGWEIS